MNELIQNDYTKKRVIQLCNEYKEKKLLIYCAGNLSKLLFKEYQELRDINIIGFIDSNKNKQNQKILNYTIYAPDQIKDLKPDAILIITENVQLVYQDIIALKLEIDHDFEIITDLFKPIKISYLAEDAKKKILHTAGNNCIGTPLSEILYNHTFKKRTYTILDIFPGYEQSYIELNSIKIIIKSFWKNNNLLEYKFLTYKNLNLYSISKKDIYCNLLKYSIEKENDLNTVKKYFSLCIYYIESYSKLLDKENLTTVIVSQGADISNRILVELARKLNIQTIAYENSFLKDYIFIDDCSGMICNRHSLGRNSWDKIKATELTHNQKQLLSNSLESFKITIPQGDRNKKTSNELKRKIGIPEDKKIALFIGQVYLDSVVIIDSYVYKNPIEYILHTAELFSNYEDYYLIIRLHPREYKAFDLKNNQINLFAANMTYNLLRESGIENYKNIKIIQDFSFNTYDLMDIAEFGITICSQAGLEMLYRKKPLIVSGDAFYSRKGFTYDVTLKEAYPSILKKVIENPNLTKRQEMDIDKFLYHMLFEYLYPRNIIESNDRLLKLFK